MKIETAIQEIEHGHDLGAQDAQDLFDVIFKGEAGEEQIATLLTALHNKGEAVSEIQGAVLSMRANMKPLTPRAGAVDIVGTGGDGYGTLNVSTAAAIVTAGAGVPVAKHGNRAATSKSGSSDVLSALGLNLEPAWEKLQQSLDEIGLVFLFAPRHHPAMKHVAPVRKKLHFRTIFNLLGPLTNPASVTHHVIGVYDEAWSMPVAETLKALHSHAAWVTHGQPGLDEISNVGTSHVHQLMSGALTDFDISPKDVGLPLSTIDDIRGGESEHNAQALRELLDGKKSAYRNIVVMNAGAAIFVAGNAKDYKEGVRLAEKSIDSGAAKKKIDALIACCN